MDGSRIKVITSEGISYLDGEGNGQFIDFAACYANYLKAKTSPKHWEKIKQLNNWTNANWENYLELIENWKEVAVGNISGNPAYMDFHSNPRTIFTFTSQQEFLDMQRAIGCAGWHIFDLS